MKNHYKLQAVVLFFISCTMAQAQVVPNIDWVQNYSEKDQIENAPSAIDINNNVYVTGQTFFAGTRDFTTIKYDEFGVQQWVVHYDGPANGTDHARAIALDNAGNIYVTGESEGIGTGYDYATVKYDPSGVELWSTRYNGTGNGDDVAQSIAVDNAGNIYITGSSWGGATGTDYTTVKYNASGVQQWVARYDAGIAGYDAAIALVKGTGNRLYVTGTSENTGTGQDIVTLRYNSNTGNPVWSNVVNGAGNGRDVPSAILVDGATVAITGLVTVSGAHTDYYTAEINGNTGTINWSATYDGYGAGDEATALVKDGSNNYVVTGKVLNGANYEYHTVMYTGAGSQQWVNTEALDQAFTLVSPQLAVDFLDHFYVCGERTEGTVDVFIYQVTPGGNTAWRHTYDGGNSGLDAAIDLSVNNMGQIYLAAQTQNSAAKYDYTTIKYSQTPVYFPPDFNDEVADPLLAYYENKGQLMNTSGFPADNVSYYASQKGYRFYCHDKGFSFVFESRDSVGGFADTTHHVALGFKDNNPNAKPYHFEDVPLQHNYYLPHIPNGITGVTGYNRLFYPNYYPGIDLHLYNSSEGLKYYFVVRPGEDPGVIIHDFLGADVIFINGSNELEIATSLGTTKFVQPIAYQVNPSLSIMALGAAYWNALATDEYGFTLPAYNAALPLIIQVDQGLVPPPTGGAPPPDNLYWSTYYGGGMATSFNDVQNDNVGNTYITGNTTGSNFPLAIGQSFVPTFTAGWEAVLVKLNDQIVPQWVTFYGGATDTDPAGTAPDEFAYSVAVRNSGSAIYIGGITRSTDLVIEDGGGLYWTETSPCTGSGCQGGFVARFTPSGALEWSTYIEGNGNWVYDLAINGQDFFYLVGGAANTLSLDATGGVYNSSVGGGMIMKFTPGNDRIWSTRFESSEITSVAIDNLNQVYVTGAVDGTFPIPLTNEDPAYPDTHTQSSYDDAFIGGFDQNGNLLYCFYYGGVCTDIGTSVEVDDNRNVYVAGVSDEVPTICPGSYDLPVIGSGNLWPANTPNHWIMKVAPYSGGAVQLLDAGYFGGGGTEDVGIPFFHAYTDVSLAVRKDGYVFLSGETSSSTIYGLLPQLPLPASQPAGFYVRDDLQSDDVLNEDAYIAAFDPAMNLVWMTYFGSDRREGSSALSVSESDNRLYFVGNTDMFQDPMLINDLPKWDYDGAATNAYYQEWPWVLGDHPGWAAMFELTGIEIPIGIADYTDEGGLLIYPNPNNGTFTASATEKIEYIEVYDVTGKLVIRNDVNTNLAEISLDESEAGMYFLVAYTESGIMQTKILKQ